MLKYCWTPSPEKTSQYLNIDYSTTNIFLRIWPNLTWRIAGVSIRQQSLHCPSIADLQCEYSPEGTRVIPHETICVLPLSSIPKLEKIMKILFIPDPKLFMADLKLFMPGPNLIIVVVLPLRIYSYRIRNYSCRI